MDSGSLKKPLTKRLFTGIPLSAALRSELSQVHRQNWELHGIRWVPEENLHLTTVFLGDVPVDSISDLQQALMQVASRTNAFQMRWEEHTPMPKGTKARMIWAKLHANQEFETLTNQLKGAIQPVFPMKEEHHPVNPHITLARFKQFRDIQRLKLLPAPKDPIIPIQQLTLWESRLSSSGATYQVVEVFPLKTP